MIQQAGGTSKTLNAGLERVAKMRAELARQTPVPMALNELVVGTVCGGSDGTSGGRARWKSSSNGWPSAASSTLDGLTSRCTR